jgi:hypothetical protein
MNNKISLQMIHSTNSKGKFNPYFLETLTEEQQKEYEIECARQLAILLNAVEK